METPPKKLSSEPYQKSFAFIVRPIGKEIRLVETIASFGTKEYPFPKDWKDNPNALRVISDYKNQVLDEHFEVEIIYDEDFEFTIEENNPPIHSASEMIEFGEFIRTNYYGAGCPKLISYDQKKFPNGTIEDIYGFWKKYKNLQKQQTQKPNQDV